MTMRAIVLALAAAAVALPQRPGTHLTKRETADAKIGAFRMSGCGR